MMDAKRELARIHRGLGEYQNKLGESVLWFEYDPLNSEHHHVFNEGGHAYRPGLVVPVMWITETSDIENYSEVGKLQAPTLRFAVVERELRKVGLSNPADTERHLNDIVIYRSTYWGITSYQRRGRLNEESVMIGVNAVKVRPDDQMSLDTLPDLVEPGEARRPRGYPNEDLSLQVFPHHELPALQAIPEE